MRALAVAIAGLACVPAAASAATRYVDSPGAGSGACATEATACSYGYVLNGAGSVAGDTVVVLRPTTFYSVGASPIVVTKKLLIRGEDGDRPIIRTTAANIAFKLDTGAADSTVSHLEIQSTNNNGYPMEVKAAGAALSDLSIRGALVACLTITGAGVSLTDTTLANSVAGGTPSCLAAVGDGATISDVTVTTNDQGNGGPAATVGGAGSVVTDSTFANFSANQTTGLQVYTGVTVRRVVARGSYFGIMVAGNATITDSVAIGSGAGSAGVAASSGIGQLRNVTAWATGAGALGVRAIPAMMGGSSGGALVARNVIARGEAADVSTSTAGAFCLFPPCSDGTIAVDHSNFRTATGPAGTITDGGANQTGDPLFADPAALNFRLGAGSPAIDAGVADAANGTTDLDKAARTQGAAIDIGAFETVPAAAPGGGGGAGDGSGAGGGNSGNGGGSGAGGGAAADKTAPALTQVSLSRKRFRTGGGARRGTVLRLTASEPVTITARIAKARKGAKAAGSFSRKLTAGKRRVRFAGRLRGRALAPGRYVMVIRAKDLAGNPLAKPLRRAFRITGR